MTRSRSSAGSARRLARAIRLHLAAPAVLLASVASIADGQSVAGGGQDAIVVPRGVIRAELSGDWRNWRERFSSSADGTPLSTRVRLGAEQSGDPYGPDQLPSLRPIQTTVRDLARSPLLDVSLGAVTTRVDALSARSILSLEMGVGARLALLASVPYVQTTASVATDVDGTGANANLGFNPVFIEGSTAGAQNAVVVSSAIQARDQLQALIASCGSTPGGTGCAPIVADPAAAQALLAEASAVASGLLTIYGTDVERGSAFIPRAGSAPATQIGARLTALASALGGVGITALPSDASLVGATPITEPQLLAVGAAAGGIIERYGVGDIEVGAKFLVLDTFGSLPRATRPGATALRLAVAGVFRYGRNSADSLGNPFDIGVGGGQNDIEGRAHADVAFGNRTWVSVTGRYGVQLADQQRLAADGSSEALVNRDLGDYIELEIVPRYALGRWFAIAGVYRFRHKSVDEYTGTFPASTGGSPVDASVLGTGTETREQRAGGGLLFSTMDAYAQGRARLPFEVNYVYTRTVTGAGRLVFNAAEHRIGARMYVRLFGGRN